MSEAGLIYQAIPRVMATVGAIEKGRRNTQQNYAFRGIDDVFAAFQRPLAENGVFYIPEVIDKAISERTTKSGSVMIYTVLTVAYTFYASDGSSVRAVVQGEAMDSGDKSSNKAMSAALKYALLQIFCVPTAQDDADFDAHEFKPNGKNAPKLVHPAQPKALPAEDAEEYGELDPEGEEMKRLGLVAEIKRLFLVRKTLEEFREWWGKVDGDNKGAIWLGDMVETLKERVGPVEVADDPPFESETHKKLHKIIKEWQEKGQSAEAINSKIASVCSGATDDLDVAEAARACHALENWHPEADAKQGVGRRAAKR